MSFRWRLTLTYALLLGLTLVIAGSLSYVVLSRTLYRNLDETLIDFAHRQAVPVTRLPHAGGSSSHAGPRPRVTLDAVALRQPLRLTEYDAQGAAIDWGPSRVGFVSSPGIFQIGSERGYMLATDEGWIQVSQSDSTVRTSLGQVLRLELLGTPLLLLLALGVGYLLADRALRPVDQVSDLAARIARGGHPGERVPPAPGSDELARLTRTINDMLGKLDEQLARERLFAHASAHELRTPISVIRAAAGLALEQERTPQQYRETLYQVKDVSEDMSQLTERLMGLARATSAGTQHTVNLADIALMVTEMHTTEARHRNIVLGVRLADVETVGDYDALLVAAGNLLQNAIKYSPPGTTVHVSCETDVERARLVVEDAGPGIPEEEMARLTQPFQRGLQARGVSGAGLGLALVQAIVSAHQGTLRLTNLPGGGLRTELVLPRLMKSDGPRVNRRDSPQSASSPSD